MAKKGTRKPKNSQPKPDQQPPTQNAASKPTTFLQTLREHWIEGIGLSGVMLKVGGWLDLYSNASSISTWVINLVTFVVIGYCVLSYREFARNKKRFFIVGAILLALWVPKGFSTLPGEWHSIINRVAVTGIFIAVWLFSFLLSRNSEGSQTQPQTVMNSWQVVLQRWWRRFGVYVFGVLLLMGAGAYWYYDRLPTNKIIILVADFEGPKQKYFDTPALINRLKRATDAFPEVEVDGLDAQITEREGSKIARAKGREKKASIVIWGIYDDTLNSTVHIELLSENRQLQDMTQRKNQMDYGVPSAVSNPSLTIKENISGDMGLVTLLLLGSIRYEAADYEGATLRLSKAIEQKTTSQMADYQIKLLVLRGNVYLDKGDDALAFTDYNQAIALKPDDADAHTSRGYAYYKSGNANHAISDYCTALNLKPDDEEIYWNLGNAYESKEDYGRAIEYYDNAILLKSDFAFCYISRGVTYSLKGDFDRAITNYSNAIDLKPNDATRALAHSARGHTYRVKRDFDRAIDDYNEAIALKPNYGNAYFARGVAYSDKGKHSCAISSLTKAIKLTPYEAGAYYSRGFAYSSKADYDRAISDFDTSIAINPEFGKAYFARGIAYKSKGDTQQAVLNFRLSLEFLLSPRDRQAAFRELQELGAK